MKNIFTSFKSFNENNSNIDEKEFLLTKVKEYMLDYTIDNPNLILLLDGEDFHINGKEVDHLTRNTVWFSDSSEVAYENLDVPTLSEILRILNEG